MTTRRILSVDFEVFGKVQGVFFRKYTQETSKRLGLVGWVKNTPHDTVVGTIQGEESAVKAMKTWLSKTGSPKSRIDNCKFKESVIEEYTYKTFEVTPGNDKKRKKKQTARSSKLS